MLESSTLLTVNRRIQSLLKFRFNGQPIVQALKVRNKEGKWDNIRYTILPVAQLKIFGKPSKKEIESSHVSKTIHGPCDDIATWRNRYTNKNHILNKNHINNVNNAEKKISKKEREEREYLAQELAESIREQGILSPILVRPQGEKFQIVAGERRYQAAKLAGLKDVPALIRRVSDNEAKILSLIENIQREDLNDIDRASALRELKVNLGSPSKSLITNGEKQGLRKKRLKLNATQPK